MDEDWRNAFEILMCTEICDGAGVGICDGVPSTCSSYIYHLPLEQLSWALSKENSEYHPANYVQLAPRQLAPHKTRPKTTRPTLIRQLAPQIKVAQPPPFRLPSAHMPV